MGVEIIETVLNQSPFPEDLYKNSESYFKLYSEEDPTKQK